MTHAASPPAWPCSKVSAPRLAAAGFAPQRINVQLRTLHPLVVARLFVWRPSARQLETPGNAIIVEHQRSDVDGGVVQEVALGHGSFESPNFLASPFHRVYSGEPWLRRRIAIDGPFEFPILRDLAAAGATDYLLLALQLSGRGAGAVSITTDLDGGFSDDQVALLVGLGDALSCAFDVQLAHHVSRTLLSTYVGPSTGERVLAGQIRSGDVERIEAAIWFSDLRGFTALSTSVEPRVLVAWLNAYFDVLGQAIGAHGGEILKFIGDAVLAVFPVGGDGATGATQACQTAWQAALQAHAGLAALNGARLDQGLPALLHGIGLHLGEVAYGNIGTSTRLDFTVIGDAVNLASRLEGLCGRLGRRTIASERFADHVGGLVALGTFELKGVGPAVAYGEAEVSEGGGAHPG